MAELSVVIPSYNHGHYLEQNIPKIHDYMRRKALDYEIIVVDDGSTDGTAARRLDCRMLCNRRNMGKGYSLRRGIQDSSGKYIFLTDADLAVPIHFFDRLWEHRTHDMVLGSRNVPSASVAGVTASRKLLGSLFPAIARTMLGLKVLDTQCGFKLMKCYPARRAAGRCAINGFAFDAELIMCAQSLGLSLKEVPVEWHSRPDSRVRVHYHPMAMMAELSVVTIRRLLGRYDGRN